MTGDARAGTGDRRREVGRAGEEYAAQLLAARGCEIVARNWSCRRGELDVVVLDPEGRLRFVEVRTRTGGGYGTPAESVTRRKQEKLRHLALEWLAAHPGPWRQVCFDVAAVDLSDPGTPRIDLLEDVF